MTGTNANTVLERKPRPPTRSGCVGTSRNSIRDTCQSSRAQMKTLKYQRHSRNWNTGRLTYPYQAPANVSVEPSGPGVAYQVATSSTMYCRQTMVMPTK